jgi:pyruvate/2-oxoglutarate dehydrogenase complex dihydrolipoamide dehydrogenase (E3) component
MPSKALLESANRYMTLRRAGDFGLVSGQIDFSCAEIRDRKERLVKEFADYRAKQLASGRFDLHRGWASFTDPHTVEVVLADGTKEVLTGKSFLLATGSRFKCVEVPGLAEVGFLNSDQVLELTHVPRSIIILGGGATAMEFAHFYSALGTEVTIVQRSGQILKEMDGDVACSLESAYRKRGMKVYCHTRLQKVERTETGAKRVFFEHGGKDRSVEAEEIICALGREPNTERLNLAATGLESTHGRLHVEPTQQTCVPHIFAAGDVSGPYEIVHIAIQQAELAVRNAARLLNGHGGRAIPASLEEIDYRLRLFAVFSSPEVAMVGMTEKELQAASICYNVASYPFDDHGKSMLTGETEGFVKLLTSDETKEILGAAVVGPHASELIHEIVVAMRFRATAKDLLEIPHYHPTLSEIWTYPAEELA